MATQSTYTYTIAQYDINALTKEVQQSTIVTALSHMDSVGEQVDFIFKDVLSTEDQTTLTSLVSSYVYVTPPPTARPVVVTNSPVVTTQYELNDKNLKLAKGKIILDGTTNWGDIYIQVPGTPGTKDGRYVAGGYAISQDYNPDDYVTVHIEDKDRIIAWALALAMNPSATSPIADADIIAMGPIPGYGAFPAYPVLRSYTDDELAEGQQGWYFWPLANGTATPTGETEIEPIGGYGFLPAGFYIRVKYIRPAGVTTGACRLNVYWGKLE